MRIGVIADIHGDLVALEAVLAALALEGLDRLVCLGDVATLGPCPTAVLARLRDLGCPIIRGNTDAWLLAPPHPDRAFPPTLTIPLAADTALLCCHGSPRSYNEVIAATTPDAALDAMLVGHDAAMVIVGGIRMCNSSGDTARG